MTSDADAQEPAVGAVCRARSTIVGIAAHATVRTTKERMPTRTRPTAATAALKKYVLMPIAVAPAQP